MKGDSAVSSRTECISFKEGRTLEILESLIYRADISRENGVILTFSDFNAFDHQLFPFFLSLSSCIQLNKINKNYEFSTLI